MAFLPQQDPNQQQGQNNAPPIPTFQGAGGSTSGGSGSGSGSSNPSSPGAAPSSPWQNVSTYLNANAGQSGNVANTLAGNLNDQYNTANQAIGQANTNFGQQIESARTPLNQSLNTQAATNPGQFAQDPNNVAAFQKQFNANYGGPQDFSHSQDYSDLQSKVLAGQKSAALVNQGTPGLMTLLQQAESKGGRNPTQGVTALDSLLLQENPENFGKISQAASPFANLTGYLSQTQSGLDTAAQNASREAAETKSAVQNQFLGENGVIPTFQNNLNSQLQGLQGQSQSYNDEIADIISRLGGGQQLTQQQIYHVNPTGELPAVWNDFQSAQMYPGVSPGMLAQFYQQPQGGQLAAPTMANAMTPEQIADAQALNQLTGQNSLEVPPGSLPYNIPNDRGTFQGRPAIQSIYDTLQGDQSYLPYMTPEQQSLYPTLVNHLGSLLGINGQPPTTINPVAPPAPPSPPLAPPGPPTNPGGGHHTF